MIIWKSWNWPSYRREWLQYWLHWHLVAETSSLTVKKQNFALQYFRPWMWRHNGTQQQSCWSAPSHYRNWNGSGLKTHNTLSTGHLSQFKMNGPLWSMSRTDWGHSDTGPCACWRGIQSHCITLSQCTMSWSIIWTVWSELWLRRRLHWRKTCSSLNSWLDRSSRYTTLIWLQWRTCLAFGHISLILVGICDPFRKWDKGMDINPEDETSYNTQY